MTELLWSLAAVSRPQAGGTARALPTRGYGNSNLNATLADPHRIDTQRVGRHAVSRFAGDEIEQRPVSGTANDAVADLAARQRLQRMRTQIGDRVDAIGNATQQHTLKTVGN